jgi:hypothetical protein
MDIDHRIRKLDHLNKAIRRSLAIIESDIAPEARMLALDCLADLTRSRVKLIQQIERLSLYPSTDRLDASVHVGTYQARDIDNLRTAPG